MHIRKVEPRAVPLASLIKPRRRSAMVEDDRTPLARAEFQDEASDAFGEWLWLLDRGLVGPPASASPSLNPSPEGEGGV